MLIIGILFKKLSFTRDKFYPKYQLDLCSLKYDEKEERYEQKGRSAKLTGKFESPQTGQVPGYSNSF
ncbi:uncharacterized protein Gasu_11540 [Galdieria sulphuraria]|uniref:Uncharacterized protein n=1 Tax=Galdieria sulphuraria TaxID=130081 RepID=M2W7I8_GALSU|nr:uncharacterized protein Gasu_11540 [Galdieria sulphuraria]EME31781.1 hypothetical protein Gasu_11540 [Galdieria sulphuraria]|eukprot:XP_005708301.1 hypothetical protein Gasu_11540 [Galdieria sulphuraria]